MLVQKDSVELGALSTGLKYVCYCIVALAQRNSSLLQVSIAMK